MNKHTLHYNWRKIIIIKFDIANAPFCMIFFKIRLILITDTAQVPGSHKKVPCISPFFFPVNDGER